MTDRPFESDAEGSDWMRKLGITNRLTGQKQARASWNLLISAGRQVLGSGMDYRVEHLVFSGFLARAQGLHEAAVAAIRTDNPYAVQMRAVPADQCGGGAQAAPGAHVGGDRTGQEPQAV
jgi:hypothetical protein